MSAESDQERTSGLTEEELSLAFYEKKRQDIEELIRVELEIEEGTPLNVAGYKITPWTIYGTPKSPGITFLASKIDFEANDQEPTKLRKYLSKVASNHSLNLGIDDVVHSDEENLTPPRAIFFIFTQEKLRIHRDIPRRIEIPEIITQLHKERAQISEQMKRIGLFGPDQSGFIELLKRAATIDKTINALEDLIDSEPGDGAISEDARRGAEAPEPDRFKH